LSAEQVGLLRAPSQISPVAGPGWRQGKGGGIPEGPQPPHAPKVGKNRRPGEGFGPRFL